MIFLLLTALIIFATGALLSLLAGKHYRLARTTVISATVGGALLTAMTAIYVLMTHETLTYSCDWLIPGGTFALKVDPLAAFFLLPIAILPPLAAIYAGEYLKGDAKARNLGTHFFLYCILIMTLTLVATAANVLLFIAAWEIMTISSFFLVSYDHHLAEVREAAWLYLLVAHFGLLMIVAFFLLAGDYCNSLNFADFAPLAHISTTLAATLFFLALCGFGIKAGLFPFFIWLPGAHPAAPSHISAIMSGLVVNAGVYGVLRAMTLLPPLSALWGAIILTLGMLGALYGIAMALLQKDIKRSLAYSTVENIGIIFVGLGLGILAAAKGQTGVAVLAFCGALLHLWNHTLFKGLLFLGAGSLLHGTGSRNLNLMGGLLRRMPHSGVLIIGGSIALAALPPFNGFVSEWLIYTGLLQAGNSFAGISALGIGLILALLGVVGALAILTFTRLLGIALLGEPRSPEAAHAHESSGAMLWPMRILLGFCLLIGLFPQLPLTLLSPVLTQLTAVAAPELTSILQPIGPVGLWGIILCLLILLLGCLLNFLHQRRPVLIAATWGCGFPRPTAKMAYTAEAYSEFAYKQILPQPLRPQVSSMRPRLLFPQNVHFFQQAHEVLLCRVYQPLFSNLAEKCVHLRWLQQGKLHLYLLYIFTCCTLLMLWSILDGRGL